MSTFSKVLKELMEDRGITSKSVCDSTGIPKSTFSEWTNGRVPKLDGSIVKLAKFFGVTVEYLILGEIAENEILKEISNEIEKNFTTIYSGTYRITLDKVKKE